MNSLYKFLFSIVSFFIPTNKNLYIFGSWFGYKFSDNAKYFYLHMLEHAPEKQVIWFTRCPQVYKELSDKGYPVRYGATLSNVWLHLRAVAVFYSCGANSDVLGRACNRNTIFFNLWHGTPMKMIGDDVIESGVGVENSRINVKNRGVKRVLAPVFDGVYRSVVNFRSYVLAPSKCVAETLDSAFRSLGSKSLILGYPKLDHFFAARLPCNKRILYAPTYRGEYDSERNILEEFGFKDYICKDRALYYQIEDLFDKPLAYDWPQLVAKFDSYKSSPSIELRQKFYENLDGDSCKRLANEVIKIIEKS